MSVFYFGGAGVISFFVVGTPKPQGSKRAFMRPNAKHPTMVESAGEALKDWRASVRYTAAAQGEKISGPVKVQLRFVMQRPKGHYGTGKNSLLLKQSAPKQHDKKPDIDKLARAVLDGLSGVTFEDDSKVVWLEAWKKYADPNENTGCEIYVRKG